VVVGRAYCHKKAKDEDVEIEHISNFFEKQTGFDSLYLDEGIK